MKSIYIQPAVGMLFAVLGILFGLNAKKQAERGNAVVSRIRFKLAIAFLIVGIGLWIWYFVNQQ